jgi:hypothetical protein
MDHFHEPADGAEEDAPRAVDGDAEMERALDRLSMFTDDALYWLPDAAALQRGHVPPRAGIEFPLAE